MKALTYVETISFKALKILMPLIELVTGSKTMCVFSNPQGWALYCRGMVSPLVAKDCCCFEVTSEIVKRVITGAGSIMALGAVSQVCSPRRPEQFKERRYQFEESKADSINVPDGHG